MNEQTRALACRRVPVHGGAFLPFEKDRGGPPARFLPGLLVLALSGAATAQNTYTIRRLTAAGTGLAHGLALGVDNHRNVVGELYTTGGLPRPVLWQAGVPQLLPLLPGGNEGSARAIGDGGHVAGSDMDSASFNHAILWVPAGSGTFSTIDLGIPPGDLASIANSVNRDGLVTGYGDTLSATRPVVWPDADLGPVVLPTPAAMPEGEGLALTADRLVVGYVWGGGSGLAATWSEVGGAFTLTTLPTLGIQLARAVGVDANGVVFGHAMASGSNLFHVVKWKLGAITDLGTIAGMDCLASAVNGGGDVVGTARTYLPSPQPPYVGFLRKSTQAAVDLNQLLPPATGWLLTAANDIADDGAIVGAGTLNGSIEPFLMMPVSVALSSPTPGTAGVNNSLTATGCTPNSTVSFFVALSGGETAVSGCLEGLDLASPAFLGSATSNAAGSATLSFFVPTSARGVPLLFQAFDSSACHTSSVTQYTFP